METEKASGAGVPPAASGQDDETRAGIRRHVAELARLVEPPLTLGACVLRIPEIAALVSNAVCHFDGDRYHLHAWCVMPNHVHAVVAPWGGHTLSRILHSWKSYSAHAVNRLRGTTGEMWERESFDHLVRSADALAEFVAYTEHNPVTAGLCAKPEEWPHGSGYVSGAGVPPAESAGRRPAPLFHAPGRLDYHGMKSRGELPHLHMEGGTYFVTFRLRDAVLQAGGLHHGD